MIKESREIIYIMLKVLITLNLILYKLKNHLRNAVKKKKRGRYKRSIGLLSALAIYRF